VKVFLILGVAFHMVGGTQEDAACAISMEGVEVRISGVLQSVDRKCRRRCFMKASQRWAARPPAVSS